MSDAGPNPRRRLQILNGEIKTPPISGEARRQIGFALGNIQAGELPAMPISRPMPIIGRNVHELRVNDGAVTWRIIYQIRPDVIYVGAVFAKKTPRTPQQVIDQCRKRFEQAE